MVGKVIEREKRRERVSVLVEGEVESFSFDDVCMVEQE